MPTPKEIQLKKHKTFATGLFLSMVVIYIWMVYLSHHYRSSWIGYIHAFSEAAMVGALADWFAVTALFRYPLGIRIPHTNLIENKKNDIGENLGAFVKENFLTPTNVRPYIERLDVVSWVTKWIHQSQNQHIVIQEVAGFAKKILNDLNSAEVVDFITQKVTEAIRTMDFSMLAAKGLRYAIDKKEAIKILDKILPEIRNYASDSQDIIRERVNKQRPFIGFLAGKKISKEFTQGIVDFIDEIDKDKNHWLREKINVELEKLYDRLNNDDSWKAKMNSWKDQFVHGETILPYINDAWNAISKNLFSGLDDENSTLYQYLIKNVEKISNDLQKDKALQNRINSWVRKFLFTTILKNSDQVEKIIGNTVSQWKGRELSEKLELEIGKDLQFIRVNGTIVGGLVGLLIYTITTIIFG